MSLTHIPTVASIINRFQRGDFDPLSGFDEVLQELQSVCNSWQTTAQAVGGKPEKAPEYIIAKDATRLLTILRGMARSKYQPTMRDEVGPNVSA